MSVSSLAGKVCLITGASSGIGSGTALVFAKLGAKLALTGRNKNALKSIADQCQILTSNPVFCITANLTEEEDRKRVINQTVEHFGKLDCLVNNAGIFKPGGIENANIMEIYDEIMTINTKAPLHLLHLAVPHLIATKGNVVNVSSVNGLRSFSGIIAYNVSKTAIDQITTCAALELASKGIRVNSVNPGMVKTEVHRRGGVDEENVIKLYERSKETHPLGRVGTTEEVGNAIAFLASDASNFVTGVKLPVDGGRHATCLR